MKILFKYATRSRPELFKRGIESIINNVASDNYHILVTVDHDDDSMDSSDVLGWIENLKEFNKIEFDWGDSDNKIHAINRGVEKVKDWDLLINFSDDMIFTQKGFDDVIRRAFTEKDLCVHFPDQYQGVNCMTMSMMDRAYYDRDKFIYNPIFESLWCDVVAQEVAQIRGRYKFVNEQFIVHLHPSLGYVEYDEQAKRTEGTREDGWAIRKRDYNRYLELKKEYDPTNIFPIRQL